MGFNYLQQTASTMPVPIEEAMGSTGIGNYPSSWNIVGDNPYTWQQIYDILNPIWNAEPTTKTYWDSGEDSGWKTETVAPPRDVFGDWAGYGRQLTPLTYDQAVQLWNANTTGGGAIPFKEGTPLFMGTQDYGYDNPEGGSGQQVFWPGMTEQSIGVQSPSRTRHGFEAFAHDYGMFLPAAIAGIGLAGAGSAALAGAGTAAAPATNVAGLEAFYGTGGLSGAEIAAGAGGFSAAELAAFGITPETLAVGTSLPVAYTAAGMMTGSQIPAGVAPVVDPTWAGGAAGPPAPVGSPPGAGSAPGVPGAPGAPGIPGGGTLPPAPPTGTSPSAWTDWLGQYWPQLLGPVLGGLGSYFQGQAYADAAESAAQAQLQAAQIAADTQKELFYKGLETQQPWLSAGQAGLTSIMRDLYGPGFQVPEQGFDYNNLPQVDYTENAAYQWQKQQGEKAINQQLAARGLYGSGPGIGALSEFNQSLSAQEVQRKQNLMTALAGYGGQTAGAQANAYASLGNNLSNIYLGQGNAMANMYNQQGQAYGNMWMNLANTGIAGLNSYQTARGYNA